ncbi:hypothetical protein D920_00393, partial [Enterococcus faecalis 13-SD-W-01]
PALTKVFAITPAAITIPDNCFFLFFANFLLLKMFSPPRFFYSKTKKVPPP